MRGLSRILTDEQVAEIADLRELGWGLHKIVRHFAKVGVKVSASTIEYQCMKVGADLPASMRNSTRIEKTEPSKRNGYLVRPFLTKDDALLIELEGEGVSRSEIARRLNRRRSSVYGRLLTLARRDARAEDSA